MNPEMQTPISDLIGLPVVWNIVCAWILAGGPRRIRARLAKRAGRRNRG